MLIYNRISSETRLALNRLPKKLLLFEDKLILRDKLWGKTDDFLFVINPKIRFMLKVSTNFSNFYREKSDALVGRVSAFHIMQTCELALFPERHRKYPKLQNLRIML
jgi:hypothetical protein